MVSQSRRSSRCYARRRSSIFRNGETRARLVRSLTIIIKSFWNVCQLIMSWRQLEVRDHLKWECSRQKSLKYKNLQDFPAYLQFRGANLTEWRDIKEIDLCKCKINKEREPAQCSNLSRLWTQLSKEETSRLTLLTSSQLTTSSIPPCK